MVRYLFVSMLLFVGCRSAKVLNSTTSRADSTVQRTEAAEVQYSRVTTRQTDFVPHTYMVQVPYVIRDTMTQYRTEYRTVMIPAQVRETEAETSSQQQVKTEFKAVSVAAESEIKQVQKQGWHWSIWLSIGIVLGFILAIFSSWLF